MERRVTMGWKLRSVMLGLVVAAGLAGTSWAESPWKRIGFVKQRVEANPQVDYALTQQNGPWMIMAATFSSDGADAQAKALVFELRSKHNLPAFVHPKKFDYTESVKGLGVDEYNRPKRMRHVKNVARDEYAVLVGNYSAFSDPKAQRDLDLVKAIYPDALRPTNKGQTTQQLAWWYNLKQQVTRQQGKKPQGPMGRAFITTNPLLPAQFFGQSQGVDKFVEDMNRGVRHSLLDCPGKYTVLVATFKGQVVLDQSKIQKIESGAEAAESKLATAAEHAHQVCEKLRASGYDAYEFHDRSASMVTVGSFESVGTPRRDGKTEINPKMFEIMQSFAGADAGLPPNLVYKNALRPAIGRRPKILDGIPLDVQPMPVQVPRRSFQQSIGVR